MLFRRACLVPLTLGLLGLSLTACDTSRPSHPTNPDKLAVRTVAPFLFDNGPSHHPVLDLKATLLGVTRMLQTLYPTTTTSTTVPRPVVTAPVATPSHLATSGDYHSWSDWPQWQRLGRCEQPGPGPDGIWWNRPGKYPGGLGILASSSASVGGSTRLDLAPPAEQIIVARRIRDRYGWGAWACARSFGW